MISVLVAGRRHHRGVIDAVGGSRSHSSSPAIAACDEAPKRPAKGGIAQSVAHRIDGGVDVTEPVGYKEKEKEIRRDWKYMCEDHIH